MGGSNIPRAQCRVNNSKVLENEMKLKADKRKF